jgi:hypothetical protein
MPVVPDAEPAIPVLPVAAVTPWVEQAEHAPSPRHAAAPPLVPTESGEAPARSRPVSLVMGFVLAFTPLALFLVGYLLLYGTGSPGGWRLLSSPDGGFSILMPGRWMESLKTAGPPGQLFPLAKSFSAQFKGSTFSAAFTDVAGAQGFDPQRQRDVILQRLRGTLRQDLRPVASADGTPGFEFQVNTGDGRGRALIRLFHNQGKLYELMVVGPRVTGGSADVRRFFDSFTLVNGARRR